MTNKGVIIVALAFLLLALVLLSLAVWADGFWKGGEVWVKTTAPRRPSWSPRA